MVLFITAIETEVAPIRQEKWMLCNLNKNLPPVSTIAVTGKPPAQPLEVWALGHCRVSV